jgi:hypothetical protein
MCSKAEEIQKEWKPQVGDWQYWSNDKTKMANILMITSLQKKYKANIRIWLPTQEQLQEMLEEIKNNTYIAFRFNHFLNVEYNNVTFQPAYILLNSINPIFMCSMNEFWIAFVMKERWNKIWDGENWKELINE